MIINPYVFTSAPALLLDTYPSASVAYSLRKLRSAYSGNCIRVRRSSDNTEQDFGFVNNELDTASLLTFCGAGNGLITTWYDQSGNGNNIAQSAAASQPQIVSSGNLIYENSKITIEYNNSYMFGSYQLADDTDFLISAALRINSSNITSHPRIGSFNSSANSVNLQYGYNGSNQYFVRKDNATLGTTAQTNILSNQYLLLFESVSNAITIDRNNLTLSTTTTSNPAINSSLGNGIHLFKGYNTTAGYINTGNFQELVMWASNQSSNKAGIKSNTNTYYSVY